jgi:hypothetical protein
MCQSVDAMWLDGQGFGRFWIKRAEGWHGPTKFGGGVTDGQPEKPPVCLSTTPMNHHHHHEAFD